MRCFIKTDSTGKLIKNNFGRFVTLFENPTNIEGFKEISEEETAIFDNLDGKIPYWNVDKIVLKSMCKRYLKNKETGEIKPFSMVEDEACPESCEESTEKAYKAYQLKIKKEQAIEEAKQENKAYIQTFEEERYDLRELILLDENTEANKLKLKEIRSKIEDSKKSLASKISSIKSMKK